jgi:hypothetical protein
VIRRLILGALAALCLWPAAASAQVINSTPPSCAKAGANTVTASAPVLDCTQTWNAGGVTFTGLKFNATDTASASGSLLLDLRVNNSQMLGVDKLGNGSAQVWAAFGGGVRAQSNTGTFALGTSLDVILARDAANILALRNGVSAQAFNIYNTYTDASNYERGFVGWSGGSFKLATQSAGTGSARGFQFSIGASDIIFIGTDGMLKWNSDNTYDIGASGANRPRDEFLGRNLSVGGALTFIGTTPAVTGTGSPTIATGSTDTSGEVTGGTLATSIVITFASAKTNAPFCVVTSQTAAITYTISTTAITVTLAATTGEKVDYHCTQH